MDIQRASRLPPYRVTASVKSGAPMAGSPLASAAWQVVNSPPRAGEQHRTARRRRGVRIASLRAQQEFNQITDIFRGQRKIRPSRGLGRGVA